MGHDGERAWVVQLHRGATRTGEGVLVSGAADSWTEFEVLRGPPALRKLLSTLQPGQGIILSGEVWLTSHIAHLIRKADIPAKMKAIPFEEAA
jgi:hypothetical protein